MMNIILACDDKFCAFCAVAIKSILRYDDDINFYIFTIGLNDKNILKLERMNTGKQSRIQIVTISKEHTDKFPMPKGEGLAHISIATYLRLFAPLVLPNVSKAIYLDCDILVRRSLKGLWNINIEDYYLGAVYHQNILSINNGAFNRLNIPIEQGYFNAGVLLMNLDKCRKDNVFEKWMSFIEIHAKDIVNHDQDVLNAVCGPRTLMLPAKWNTMNFFMYSRYWNQATDCYDEEYQKEFGSPERVLAEAGVFHFASRPKPWEIYCVHPVVREFRDILKEVPFEFHYREYSSLKGCVKLFLKPQIMGYARYSYKCYKRNNPIRWMNYILDIVHP